MSQPAEKPQFDLNQSAVARYLQLGTLFRRRVETGQWPIGEQIPTVDELAQECGVAKLTIRQALGLLEEEGLIDRFRAKGTFVKARPARELWCEVHTDLSGMLMAREGATIEVLSERKQSALPALQLQAGTPAASYRALRRRHSREEQPFLLADLYIDERLTPKIAKAAYTSKTALRLIMDIPGLKIASVRQTLTIGTADLETSLLLKVPLNAPVAYIQRVAIDDLGSVALLTTGIYRGDVVRLEMHTDKVDAR
jgi:GntR family transcriptional regulator